MKVVYTSFIDGEIPMAIMIEEPRQARVKLEDYVPFSTPKTVFIDICDRCNLACSFCPCNHSDVALDKRHKVMSLPTFEKIVNDLSGFPERVRVVTLHAYGEPLMNPNLINMINVLHKQTVCVEIRFTTNGTLLTNQLVDNLADSHLNLFRLSLNGLNAEQYKENCMRSIDFDKMISNVKRLKLNRKHNLKIAIKTTSAVVTNKKEEQAFSELANDIGDYWYVENIDDIWAGFDSGEIQQYTNVADKWHEGRKTSVCDYPFTHMMVFSNGDIGICPLDWAHKTVINHINDTTLREVWESNQLREAQIRFLEHEHPFEPCKECKYKSIDIIDDAAAEKMLSRIR
jgi:radical SAM protein with 4Fe4S-binding SPASM domain